MSIAVNGSFFVRLSHLEDGAVTRDIVQVTGTGLIEGEKVPVSLAKDIAYDGSMTLDELVAAAQVALAGKTTDLVTAVNAAPLPKPPKEIA